MMSNPNMGTALGHRAGGVTRASGHIPVDRLKYRTYVRAMTRISDKLDAVGLLCPLPVLKARKRLRALAPGDVLAVSTDDPAAIVDIPHFCAEAGHALLSSESEGPVTHWHIRKGG
jgi:tRNA 2-thiouridine synthesizing protein A